MGTHIPEFPEDEARGIRPAQGGTRAVSANRTSPEPDERTQGRIYAISGVFLVGSSLAMLLLFGGTYGLYYAWGLVFGVGLVVGGLVLRYVGD